MFHWLHYRSDEEPNLDKAVFYLALFTRGKSFTLEPRDFLAHESARGEEAKPKKKKKNSSHISTFQNSKLPHQTFAFLSSPTSCHWDSFGLVNERR